MTDSQKKGLPVTPGQLVKAVSIALDVPKETVVQHDRNLAVAGLRTKKGRGPSAAAVTHFDAARLFVATLASIRTKDSVNSVLAFESTTFEPPLSDAEREMQHRAILVARGYDLAEDNFFRSTEKWSDPAVTSLPLEHNFIDALSSLIKAASEPIKNLDETIERFAPLRIWLVTPQIEARIDHQVLSRGVRGSAFYHGRSSQNPLGHGKHGKYYRYGIKQKREVFGTAIMLLGRAFREGSLNFANTGEALADWFDVPPKKSAKANPKKKKVAQ
jgi:hypothetical protein